MNIHATIMDFVNIFPFWDSLDSVRRIHSDLEGFALVFFALLVVSEALAHLSEDKKKEKLFDTIGIVFFAVAVLAEIAAYPYGKRDDTLSGQVIDSLDAKAGDAATRASKAVIDSSDAEKKSGDALDKGEKANKSASNALSLAWGARREAASVKNDLAETQKRVEYVHKEAFERILNPRFSEALKGRPTGTVEVRADPKDNDAYTFGIQITGALRKAGWIASDPLPISWDKTVSELPSPPTELRVQVSGTLCLIAREVVIQPGVNTAAGAIWDACRSAEETNGVCIDETDPTLPDDHFVIVVGQRY